MLSFVRVNVDPEARPVRVFAFWPTQNRSIHRMTCLGYVQITSQSQPSKPSERPMQCRTQTSPRLSWQRVA